MPSVTNTTGGKLEDAVQEGSSATKHSLVPDSSQNTRATSGDIHADVMNTGSSMHVTSRTQHGIDATRPLAQGINTASASPLDNRESEDELGAFDDSHLQVDQPKKKKKKSKKPKSKRGLVMSFHIIPPLLIQYATECSHWIRGIQCRYSNHTC